MKNSSNFMGRGLKLALLGLVAFLAVGCGSSNEEFVSTGNGGFATTGTLSYLLQVNNVTSVPNGTTTLRFDLFDDQNNLVLTTDSALTDTVTVDSLPPSVRSTTVTAFDEDGFPIGQVTVNTQVVLGTNGQVDLSGANFTAITYDALAATPDPVEIANDETQQLSLTASFSNGSQISLPTSTFATDATFTSADTNVATVSTGGLISVEAAGNTTVTANYTINGVSQSDTVDVSASVFNVSATFPISTARTNISNEFEEFSVTLGTSRQPTYVSRLTGPDGETVTVSSSELTFAFSPAVAGFSVSAQGEVSVADSVQGGTTANLLISYTDENNRTFSDVMVITAVEND